MNIKMNVANWDRIARVILGIALLFLGFGGVVSGAWGIVLGIVGAVFLMTGLVGWCPLYALLRFRTR